MDLLLIAAGIALCLALKAVMIRLELHDALVTIDEEYEELTQSV